MNTTGLGIYKIGSTYAIPKTIGTNHLKYEGAVDHAVFKFAYKEKNPAADKEGFYSILREAGMSVHLGQDRAIYRNKMIFLESDLVSGGSTNNVPNYTKDVKNRDILTLVPTLNLDTKFGRVAYKPKYKVADRESYFTGAYFKRLGKLPAPLDASNTEERGTVFPGDWKG